MIDLGMAVQASTILREATHFSKPKRLPELKMARNVLRSLHPNRFQMAEGDESEPMGELLNLQNAKAGVQALTLSESDCLTEKDLIFICHLDGTSRGLQRNGARPPR